MNGVRDVTSCIVSYIGIYMFYIHICTKIGKFQKNKVYFFLLAPKKKKLTQDQKLLVHK